MTIKLWDWDAKWALKQTFEGHIHYVMQIVINPKDNNTFASASLDRTVKVWQLGSTQANFTLEGHEKGVNCIDYYSGGDKPYLVSGGDDRLVKIWDYQVGSTSHRLLVTLSSFARTKPACKPWKDIRRTSAASPSIPNCRSYSVDPRMEP